MIVTFVPPPGFPTSAAMVAGRVWGAGDTVVDLSTHDLTALEAAVLWKNAMPLADHPRQLAMLGAAILTNNAERLPLWPGQFYDPWTPRQPPMAVDWNPRQLVALADDVVAAHARFGPGAVGYVDIEPSSANGAIEDSSIRSRIGQRAFGLLSADDRLSMR